MWAQYIRITFYQFTYSNSFSRKTTGSGSLIAALSSPRASSELYGDSTFNPGQEAYHAAKHWIITKKTKKKSNKLLTILKRRYTTPLKSGKIKQ